MKLLDLFYCLLPLALPQLEVQALSISRNPIHHVSILENLEFSQRPQTLDTASTFQVEFGLSNERPKLRLSLRPTRNLISRHTDVQHVGPDGAYSKLVSSGSSLVYKGDAFISGNEYKTWRNAGWARIKVRIRQGMPLIEGAFSIDGVHFHIALNSNFRTSQLLQEHILPKIDSPHMIVWKDSDAADYRNIRQRSSTNESLCAAQNFHAADLRAHRSLPHRSLGSFRLELSDEEVFEDTDDSDFYRDLHPLDMFRLELSEEEDTDDSAYHMNYRRQNGWFDPRDVIGDTDGCPSDRLVAMIGVATDCTYTAEFDSIDDARENIISQLNIASQVYEDAFNIVLAIRNLTISDGSCPSSSSSSNPWNVPCSANIDVSERLSLFSDWRL